MSWQLMLGEFSPKLIYRKGYKNIAADALNFLDTINNANNNNISINNDKMEPTLYSVSENFFIIRLFFTPPVSKLL